MRLAFVVAALITAVAAPVRAEDAVQPLVRKVIAAYGGRAALERARVVREEGTVTSLMHEGVGRIARLFQRPASLRVEVAYPGEAPEVRVTHEGRGDRDGVDVTGTPAHAAMVLQAARLALPLSLIAGGASVVDRGSVHRGGKRLRALALALPGDMEIVAEIDPSTARILRSSGSMPVPGGRIEFASEYSEFQVVSGVLFARREENYARGQHTGATVLTRIELLAAAPAGTFGERL